MIKILQGTVVGVFFIFCMVGLTILFGFTDKMEAYGKLVGILFPIFLAQVIPALIGSPLTDYVRALAEAKKVKAE
jgi:hypothetical protein